MASKKKAVPVEEPEVVEEDVVEDPAEVSDDDLLALGVEMNKIMFPDEPIDYDALDSNQLLEQVLADAQNIDPADPFSEESKATLAALDVTIDWAPVKPAKGKKAPKAEKPAKVVKEKAPKEKKEKSEKTGLKRDVPRTGLGCFEGTRAGFIDNMLIRGVTEAEAIETLVEEYKIEAPKAKAAFKMHMKHLEKKGMAVISEIKGVLSAKAAK